MRSTESDPYGNGLTALTADWNWVWPQMCSPGSSGYCFIAWPSCPTGYVSRGQAGIIIAVGNTYGPLGGQINAGWAWNHPLLCCAP